MLFRNAIITLSFSTFFAQGAFSSNDESGDNEGGGAPPAVSVKSSGSPQVDQTVEDKKKARELEQDEYYAVVAAKDKERSTQHIMKEIAEIKGRYDIETQRGLLDYSSMIKVLIEQINDEIKGFKELLRKEPAGTAKYTKYSNELEYFKLYLELSKKEAESIEQEKRKREQSVRRYAH